VPNEITAVGARWSTAAAAWHIVAVAAGAPCRCALARRGRTGAVAAAVRRGRAAAALGHGRATLLRAQAAAAVVTRRVFARALSSRGPPCPGELYKGNAEPRAGKANRERARWKKRGREGVSERSLGHAAHARWLDCWSLNKTRNRCPR
jgi:hypothetical protein